MNFEEYIKKPFEDQEFEYKEAYWQSAEKLIDNHYTRVRWIRAGIIGGILIATFIASYFFVTTKETSITEPSLAQEQILNQNNQDHSSSPIQSPISEENTTLLNSETEDSGSINPDSDSEKSIAQNKSADPRVAASLLNGAGPAKKNGAGNNAITNTGASSKPSSKPNTASSKAFAAADNPNGRSEFNAEKTTSTSGQTLLDPSTLTSAQENHAGVQNNSEKSNPESIHTENTIPLKSIASQSTSALDLPFKNIQGSNKLHLLNFPLHLDFGTSRPIIALPRASRMYATAEMLMYPSGNSEAFKFLGFNAGLGYQQALGKMAFLDLGVSGSFRRGNFAPSVVSTQLNYDFGPRSDAYILRPQSLFSLQVPVLLGVESGKHMLSAGVKLGFLIGVRGTSEYANYVHAFESPTGKESYSYDVVEEGWIESSGFRKFALAYALKYQYRMNSRIMIGASLQYLPSDWIANDFGKYYDFTSNEYQNPTGNPAQLIERNWLLGVELKYVLFSKY